MSCMPYCQGPNARQNAQFRVFLFFFTRICVCAPLVFGNELLDIKPALVAHNDRHCLVFPRINNCTLPYLFSRSNKDKLRILANYPPKVGWYKLSAAMPFLQFQSFFPSWDLTNLVPFSHRAPPAGLEPAIFGLEVQRLVH